MSQLTFLILDVRDSPPEEWLRLWAGRNPWPDDQEHADLIARHDSLSAEEFVLIGKWKDDAKTPARWKRNVATVAYAVWMQAASELPKCPPESDVGAFLNDWSSRTYTDEFPSKSVEKHFGLSRATTLLHFISGGRLPIFDARVRTAISRLCNSPAPNTVRFYLDSFCPLFRQIAALCGTENDLRKLDKALFSYGAWEMPTLPS